MKCCVTLSPTAFHFSPSLPIIIPFSPSYYITISSSHSCFIPNPSATKMIKLFFFLLSLFLGASGSVNGSVVEKENIKIFELKKGELSLKVTNWGASIVSLLLPDKNGIIHCSKLQIMIFLLYFPYFSVFCVQESWVMLFLDTILLRITL